MQPGRMSPRETMRGLPRVVQPFLTWVTGVPLAEARPVFRWRPTLALVAGLVQTSFGIAVGAASLALPWFLAAPVVMLCWPVIAGGMRRLDVVVVHQTLHRMFTASHLSNRVISEMITTVLWRPRYDENRREHLLHHAYPCSLRDGDTLYLRATGARPGLSKQSFRKYLIKATFSPRHHWSFFSSRMKANFFTAKPLYRLVMSLVWLAVTIFFLVVTGWWLQWVLLWFVPATVFFQNQTLLYTLSEHRWWLFDNAEGLTRAQRDALTFGRFCGEPTPRTDGRASLSRVLAWLRWWARIFMVYVPYRLCILVGDTVQHDLHHVRPQCDWANSPYVRNEQLTTKSERYFEAWGGLLSHVYVGNGVRDWHAHPSASIVLDRPSGTAASADRVEAAGPVRRRASA